jgi:hypothetical protein
VVLKGGPVERWEAIEPKDEDPVVAGQEIEFLFFYNLPSTSEISALTSHLVILTLVRLNNKE